MFAERASPALSTSSFEAVTVTVRATFQFDGVKVRLESLTVKGAPVGTPMVMVTSSVGWLVSTTS